MVMLDEVILSMIHESFSELNTTMRCRVISTSPLTIQPVPVRKYISGDQEYPLIVTANRIKQWGLVEGVPTAFSLPLNVGDTVMVAFDKKEGEMFKRKP